MIETIIAKDSNLIRFGELRKTLSGELADIIDQVFLMGFYAGVRRPIGISDVEPINICHSCKKHNTPTLPGLCIFGKKLEGGSCDFYTKG